MSMNPRTSFWGITLVEDPVLKTFDGGGKLCGIRAAYNGQYKDKSGGVVKTTSFFSLVFFGRNAEVLSQYAKKGSQIDVEAEPVENKYETKDGQKRSNTEFRVQRFTLLYGKPKPVEHNARASDPDLAQSERDFADDNIPF